MENQIDSEKNFTTRKQVAGIAKVALVCIAYFVVIIVLLHFLRPDHNPISQTTSHYAVGPYGFLMATVFFSASLASLALVVGLYRGISQPARSQIGLGLLALWAMGALIAMIFPINLDGTPLTTSGAIHRINGPLAFLSLVAGAILVSRRFKQDENWRPVHRSALTFSLLMLAGVIVTVLNIFTESGYAGLSQRILLVVFVTWFILTAVRLRLVATENRVEAEKEFWNSKAKKYDNVVSKFFPTVYEIISDRLVQDADKSDNLLDIATGTGIMAIKLSGHVANITAIDIAPEMITVAKEKCAGMQINDIDFRIGDACKLEFNDKAFDTVVASNVLHLLFKPERALREMKRVLKDNGKIIVPTFCHGSNLRSHILSRFLGLLGQKTKSRWSPKSFREFVENNGYTIMKEHYIDDKIPAVYLLAVKK